MRFRTLIYLALQCWVQQCLDSFKNLGLNAISLTEWKLCVWIMGIYSLDPVAFQYFTLSDTSHLIFSVFPATDLDYAIIPNHLFLVKGKWLTWLPFWLSAPGTKSQTQKIKWSKMFEDYSVKRLGTDSPVHIGCFVPCKPHKATFNLD